MASRKSSKVEGVIHRINHEWWVCFELRGESSKLQLTEDQSWNSDVEAGLPVVIKLLHDGQFNIISRRGNKKFIKI